MRRAETLLLKVIGRFPGFGAVGKCDDPELVATVYGRSGGDVRGFCDLLEKRGWIGPKKQSGQFEVTSEDYLHADEIRYRARSSLIGLVAIWFAEDMRAAY